MKVRNFPSQRRSRDIKKNSRIRRMKKTREKIKQLRHTRLTVNRTPRHLRAQVIDANGLVLATASTLEKAVREEGYTGNVEAAKRVGKLVAERAKEKGIEKLAFDRAGYLYHGRVAAVVDAAREAGIEI